jgi:hypothetical protein
MRSEGQTSHTSVASAMLGCVSRRYPEVALDGQGLVAFSYLLAAYG